VKIKEGKLSCLEYLCRMQDQYPSRNSTWSNPDGTIRVGRPTIVKLDSV